MPANPSLIDVMARALWLDDARRVLAERRAMGRVPDDGKDIDPAWYDEDAAMPITGASFRERWEGHARAALRSLLVAGPTPAMRKAGRVSAGWLDVNKGGDEAEAVFSAMLRAALELTSSPCE